MWYNDIMSGTTAVTMGDRGRIVIPADVRQRAGIEEGTVMVLLETSRGLVLLRRDQLRDLVQADLQGGDLVGELIAERRASARLDDVA